MQIRSKSLKHITPLKTPDDRYLQDSDDDACFALKSTPDKTPETQIKIGHTPVKVLIDSGASVNIIHKEMFERINSENNHTKLVKTNARIRAYGTDTPIELCGEFHTTIKLANDQSVDATFFVTKSKSQCILGCESSTALGLITLLNINNIAQHENPVIPNLLKKHEKLFKGTGNWKGLEVKLEIDDSLPHVAQSS